MKKQTMALSILAAACIMLAGCGKREDYTWNANENSIYITKDGTVQSALVYTSDTANKLYSEEELKAFVQEAVDDYNQGQGGDRVALISCTLKLQTGAVGFSYASPEDYLKFAEETGDNTNTVTDLKVGSVADGLPQEMKFQTPDGKTADETKLQKDKKGIKIEVEGSAVVCTEGTISYVSEGVSLKNDHAAVTPEGASCIIVQ